MSDPLPNPYGNLAPLNPSKVNSYTIGADQDDLPEIDESRIQLAIAKLRSQQSLPLAIAAGFAAAVISAALWAGITVATMFRIGYMAVGVGLLVGYSVRHSGKGLSSIYGYTGAGFALLGCVLGNFFSSCAFVAKAEGKPFYEIVGQAFTNPEFAIAIFIGFFRPMDLLFYGIAVYEAYQYSFRELTEEDALTAMDEV